MRYKLVLLLAGFIIFLDQLSKQYINKWLSLGEQIPYTSFFSLVHYRNYGAAFGFLNRQDIQWQFWFFCATTILACVLIFYFLRSAKAHERLVFWALGCILGGAIGNFIDRLRFRSVVDFLDFHVAGFHWPAFNIADIAICCGSVLLLFSVFIYGRRTDV